MQRVLQKEGCLFTGGNGSSGHRNDTGNSAPKEAILSKVGTTVTAPKPLLPVHTWHTVLIYNPTTLIFSAVDGVRRANLQDYKNQEEFLPTHFEWLAATVQIALVQAVQILVKKSDILQAGCYLLELAGLDTQVVVTNVISINSPSRGHKDNGGSQKNNSIHTLGAGNFSNAVGHLINNFVEEQRRKGSILHKVR